MRLAGLCEADVAEAVDEQGHAAAVLHRLELLPVAGEDGLAAGPVDDATYTSQLARMSSLYLLSGRQRGGR